MPRDWARPVSCRVVAKLWLTPSLVSLRFAPEREFEYEPGQFLSVLLPADPGTARTRRRVYSLARGGRHDGYELCVKITPGPGPTYLAGLHPGDRFEASAPFGDYAYVTAPERDAIFISTSSGIAPLRAMMRGERFRADPPRSALCVFGARGPAELAYANEIAALGVEFLPALTQAPLEWHGFRGRVTDWVRLTTDPRVGAAARADFYVCGGGEVVRDVVAALRARGVPDASILREAYDAQLTPAATIPVPARRRAA